MRTISSLFSILDFTPVALVVLGMLGLAWVYVAMRRMALRREVFTLYVRACARLQLPLDQALWASAGAPREVGRMMRETSLELRAGEPLALALDGKWSCIPHWYTQMLAIGELHGNLADVLDRILKADARAEEMRMNIFDRLLYPLVLCSFSVLVMQFVIVFILPNYLGMFQDMGVQPDRLWLLYDLGGLWVVLGSALWVAMAAMLGALVPLPWGPRWIDSFEPFVLAESLLHRCVPYFRKLYTRAACGRWATTVSMLVEAGCPLPDAMDEAAKVERDRWFIKTAARWADRVRNGEKLGLVLADTRFVPRSLVWQVRIAEGGADFTSALRQAGERQIEHLHRQVGAYIKALIPFLVVALGLLIGWLAISMFQCLLDITYLALE